jgi:hypothetical protein
MAHKWEEQVILERKFEHDISNGDDVQAGFEQFVESSNIWNLLLLGVKPL